MDQLTPEEREVGQENFYEAVGVSRREFLQGAGAAGLVAAGTGLGAAFFGYGAVADPVRVGVIGTGDEGNVLIGGCNPNYVQVTAICDIRPFSIHRAFHGDCSSPAAAAARPGLIKQYGYTGIEEAKKDITVYSSIEKLLADESIEAVIIALPLHLHAPVAVKAMLAGKHVLTEKLMAHNVAQCKVMAQVAAQEDLHLATGHQRHYNILYDNAVHLLRWGMIGQLHHIRAQWHRGNLPGRDSWKPHLPGGEKMADGTLYDKIAADIKSIEKKIDKEANPVERSKLQARLAQWIAQDADKDIDPEAYGYTSKSLKSGRTRTAMEELIRWRLWERTGGGLMAELGSHQLDAASIFCSALRSDGKKARPIAVSAMGGRHIFPMDREAEDHVYCMYEFPGPDYDARFDVGYEDQVEGYVPSETGIDPYSVDPNKKVVVTYSTINGNGFGGYGEVVMGTKGTLILDKEKEAMLYAKDDTSSKVGVKASDGGYAFDTQASGGYAAPAAKVATPQDVSRGYTEEIEHWAFCIRNPAPENKPKCYPEVALGDAVIALTTNVAINRGQRGEGGYVKFEDGWFDTKDPSTPDGSSVPEMTEFLKNYKLT